MFNQNNKTFHMPLPGNPNSDRMPNFNPQNPHNMPNFPNYQNKPHVPHFAPGQGIGNGNGNFGGQYGI